MNKPQAILFDFVNTLACNLRFDPLVGNARLLEYAVDRKGIQPEDVMAEVSRLESELPPTETWAVEFTNHQFNRLLFDRLGISFRVSMDVLELEFWKACVEFVPEPGISEVLSALSAHGMKMGVVSNHPGSGAVLSWELQRHGLLKHFEFVISSADYGIRKPHRVIFTSAVSRLGLKPSEVWYVGDTLERDILGANQSQMPAIWYNRRQHEPNDIARPEAEVRSWAEFTVLVQKCL